MTPKPSGSAFGVRLLSLPVGSLTLMRRPRGSYVKDSVEPLASLELLNSFRSLSYVNVTLRESSSVTALISPSLRASRVFCPKGATIAVGLPDASRSIFVVWPSTCWRTRLESAVVHRTGSFSALAFAGTLESQSVRACQRRGVGAGSRPREHRRLACALHTGAQRRWAARPHPAHYPERPFAAAQVLARVTGQPRGAS